MSFYFTLYWLSIALCMPNILINVGFNVLCNKLCRYFVYFQPTLECQHKSQQQLVNGSPSLELLTGKNCFSLYIILSQWKVNKGNFILWSIAYHQFEKSFLRIWFELAI